MRALLATIIFAFSFTLCTESASARLDHRYLRTASMQPAKVKPARVRTVRAQRSSYESYRAQANCPADDHRYLCGSGIAVTGSQTHVRAERSLARGVTAGGDLIARASADLGKTAYEVGVRPTLWCAAWLNKLLGGGTGSDLARSYVTYGRPAAPGCIGCIAVMTRGRNGGHVGIVTGYDARGNPILISGNHNRRVGAGAYPRTRVIAWRAV
ncbi:MAG: CHAP domain-containing protein [Pseudorhodoplanes sp.]|nr:CHAP domain-containing protein [Pseudorhodoplanes sp.]